MVPFTLCPGRILTYMTASELRYGKPSGLTVLFVRESHDDVGRTTANRCPMTEVKDISKLFSMKIFRRFFIAKVAAILLFAVICISVFKSLALRSQSSKLVQTKATTANRVYRWQPDTKTTKPITYLASSKVPEMTTVADEICENKTNLLFLKVHKAGSTTLSNMFFRFAIRHHLNIALPNKPRGSYGFNVIGKGNHFNASVFIPIPKGETYNIVANHVSYNRTVFDEIMPPDTIKVAIMRDPESQFVSAAYYYQLVERIKQHGGIEHNDTKFLFSTWLKDPWKIGVSQEVFNSQAADFGLPHPIPKDPRAVEAFLRDVAADFSFVMLLEYMDESIVLLRRKLCWEVRDVIHIRINVNHRKHDVAFHDEDRKLLKQWLNVDFRLYEIFSKRFWEELRAQGPDFFDEVAFFRRVLRQVEDFCQNESIPRQREGLVIPPSPWSAAISVSVKDCLLMTKQELILQANLMDRAWGHYQTGTFNATIATAKL